MDNTRSPFSMLLLGVLCIVLVVLLICSMPYGPQPREPDGSIAIATMYHYDQSAWKIYPIFGFGLAAPVFLVHSHPLGFEKKVLGWRFGPATRQG